MDAILEAIPQIPPKVQHVFAHGVYGRIMHLPEGHSIRGMKHKYSCINIILAGHLSVASIDQQFDCIIGDVFMSPEGTERRILARQDSVWMTLHGTHETDLNKLEQELME